MALLECVVSAERKDFLGCLMCMNKRERHTGYGYLGVIYLVGISVCTSANAYNHDVYKIHQPTPQAKI